MKRFILFLLLMLLTMTLAVTTAGQDKEDEKVVIGTNLVSVNISVTDEHGRHVAGLGRDSFAVFDNQVRQRIAHVSESRPRLSFSSFVQQRLRHCLL